MRRAKYPMREKKKAESRARLIRAAQHLFSTQGYENTTLEEVADRVGLHVQTLYRHFANKQDLAMAGPSENVDRFRQAIRAADRDVDTFAFWRNWLLGALDAAGDPALSALRRQGEMLRSQRIQRPGQGNLNFFLIDPMQNYIDRILVVWNELCQGTLFHPYFQCPF